VLIGKAGKEALCTYTFVLQKTNENLLTSICYTSEHICVISSGKLAYKYYKYLHSLLYQEYSLF
jgi:hypothetical protein